MKFKNGHSLYRWAKCTQYKVSYKETKYSIKWCWLAVTSSSFFKEPYFCYDISLHLYFTKLISYNDRKQHDKYCDDFLCQIKIHLSHYQSLRLAFTQSCFCCCSILSFLIFFLSQPGTCLISKFVERLLAILTE